MEAGEVTKQTIVNVLEEEGVYFVTFLKNNVHSKMHVHHPNWTGSLKSGTKLFQILRVLLHQGNVILEFTTKIR